MINVLSLTADQINAAIASGEKGARARLCAGEGEAIVERLAEAAGIAGKAGLPVEKIKVYSDGGAVTKNYNKGYGGDTTVVKISAAGVSVTRSPARTVKGNNNGVRRFYISTEGPTDPLRGLARKAGLKCNSLGQILLVQG